MNVTEKRTDGRAVRFHGGLPEDIVFDILSLLPIKSLKRFESVSRSFSCLFRTNHFIANHLRHFKQPCLPFHHHCDTGGSLRSEVYLLRKESLVLELVPFELFPNFDIIGSCNGIVFLFRRRFNTDPYHDHKLGSLLWNPAIGQTRCLPPCNTCCFDMRCQEHIMGFGWDSISNDYKVVRLHCIENEFDIGWMIGACDVYSCVAESWSTSFVSYLKNVNFIFKWSLVTLPGHLYWSAEELDVDVHAPNGRSFIVLAFDLHRNVFEKIRMPDSVGVYDNYVLCVQEENSLALLSIRRPVLGSDDLYINLWVLSDASVRTGERSPWNLLFNIVESIPFRCRGLGSSVLGMYGDEIVCSNRLDRCSFLFNYKTGEAKRIPYPVSRNSLSSCTQYVESLIPISADGFKGQCLF